MTISVIFELKLQPIRRWYYVVCMISISEANPPLTLSQPALAQEFTVPNCFLQGINLVKELIDAYGLEVVQAYMSHIQVKHEKTGS